MATDFATYMRERRRPWPSWSAIRAGAREDDHVGSATNDRFNAKKNKAKQAKSKLDEWSA